MNWLLLIYGQVPMPASLIVHGHAHQCRIALADDPNGCEATRLTAEIMQALTGADLITIDEADDAALLAAAS